VDDTLTAAVRLRDVVKDYGSIRAVDGLSLDVPWGTTFGLLGPNGAGKSTTMRLLTGTAVASSGTVEVLGLPVPARGRDVRGRTGLVPQVDVLDDELTCRETLDVHARLYGVPASARQAAIARGLERARLVDRADDLVRDLSGGMRRRLLIARGLVHDPLLVLLDEPTVGLDPQVRQGLWSQIEEIRATGATTVLTTHYIEEAERLCDLVAIVDHGRLLALDPPEDLIRAHVGSRLVVEVSGDADTRARLGELAESVGVRHRSAGTAVALFTDEPDRVLAGGTPGDLDGARRVARPANLEDVFVVLTGEAIR
jgi:lipooligosaccharide transport system ATP-binding protein